MVICELMASEGEGGLENHFYDVVNGLSSHNEVHVIANSSFENGFSESVTFHAVNLNRSRSNIFLLLEVLRLIRKIAPDVVHVHASKGSSIVSKIKRFLPCPVVATVHSLKRNVSMFTNMDALIGVSRDVLTPINHGKKYVVYNGRLIEKLPPLPDREKKVIDTAVIVGRLVDVKRVDVAIDAIAKVPNLRLLVVGDGSNRAQLAAQVDQLGIADRVEFLGYRTDAQNIMQSADVVIISSDREGFPLVMVEALLLGKYLVSTKVPGVVEFIPPNYLSETGDSDMLAKSIQSLMHDPERSYKDFLPVWEKARYELTLDSQLQRTQDILQSIARG